MKIWIPEKTFQHEKIERGVLEREKEEKNRKKTTKRIAGSQRSTKTISPWSFLCFVWEAV